MTRHRTIDPEGLGEIPGSHHIVVAQGSTHVYLSGQTPTGPDGTIIGAGDLAEQTRVTFENVKTCLAAAGASPDDVVRTMIYVVGWTAEMFEPLFAGALAAWGEELPTAATTLIGVQGLFYPGQLIEVDVTAVLD